MTGNNVSSAVFLAVSCCGTLNGAYTLVSCWRSVDSFSFWAPWRSKLITYGKWGKILNFLPIHIGFIWFKFLGNVLKCLVSSELVLFIWIACYLFSPFNLWYAAHGLSFHFFLFLIPSAETKSLFCHFSCDKWTRSSNFSFYL